jgi:hypothetical protein
VEADKEMGYFLRSRWKRLGLASNCHKSFSELGVAEGLSPALLRRVRPEGDIWSCIWGRSLERFRIHQLA